MWNIQKTSENQVLASVSVAPGPACDKLNSCDETQSSVGKSCIKKRKYDNEYIKFGLRPSYAGSQDSKTVVHNLLWCGCE
jgi:hypothetical protein